MTNNPLQAVATVSPEEAHNLCQRIFQLYSEIGIRVYEMGAIFTAIKETKAWSYNYGSLNKFIADLKCSRKTFFNYKRLSEIWKNQINRVIDRCPFALGIPYTRILVLAHHFEKAETDDEIITILHDADVLSASDLAKAYGESKPVLRFTDGNPYRIINKSKGRYDITVSDCRIIWTQADGQVWKHVFQGTGRVKGQIEAVDIAELEE